VEDGLSGDAVMGLSFVISSVPDKHEISFCVLCMNCRLQSTFTSFSMQLFHPIFTMGCSFA
jgi:hypothetical protein